MKKVMGLILVVGMVNAAFAQTNIGSMKVSCVASVSRLSKATVLINDKKDFDIELKSDGTTTKLLQGSQTIKLGDVEQVIKVSFAEFSEPELVISTELRRKNKSGQIQVLATSMAANTQSGIKPIPQDTSLFAAVRVQNPEINTAQANNAGFSAYQLLLKGIIKDNAVNEARVSCSTPQL